MDRICRTNKGQVLLLFTMTLIPLLGLLGLVVDIGWMHYLQVSAQTAADAAAMAAALQFHSTIGGSVFVCGVNGVVCQAPTSCNPMPANLYLRSGCLYAQQNGFSASGNQNVTLQTGITPTPPSAPGVNSAAYWITARVTQSVPQLFSAVMGNRTGLIAARSTAAVTPMQDCIWVMDPNASASFSMSGTPDVNSACGVFINSSNGSALSGNGNPTLRASEIDIVGGYSFSGTLSPNPPSTGVAGRSDPLASLPAPNVPPGCDFSAGTYSGNISPGVYCGGIHVGNSTVTMSPGNYFLKGGAISTQSANSHLQGTGVFIYNTYDGTHPYTAFDIKATSTVSLTAPVTGTYAGILIFEDRSIPTNTYTDTFGGGSSAAYTGTIYGLKSNMWLHGNASLTAYTILVCNQLRMVGTTAINNDYSSLPTGNPLKTIALVE
jgi:Putative Flp pilus-assembly TadE/G-like